MLDADDRTRTGWCRQALRAVVALLMAGLTGCASTAPRQPETTPTVTVPFALEAGDVPVVPADVEGPVAEAWRALRQGDRTRATTLLAGLDAGGAAQPGVRALQGFLELDAGSLAAARLAFEEALAARPGHAPSLYGLGVVAEAEEDRATALARYAEAVAADPTLAEAAVRRQILELEEARSKLVEAERAEVAGDTAGAETAYAAAVGLGPEILRPYLRLADLASGRGDEAAAVSWLRRARDRVGDTPAVLRSLGLALRRAGEYADSYDVLLQLQEVAGPDADVATLVADARELYESTSLPERYRELDTAEVVHREDLAALIALRIPGLAELAPEQGVIITDIAESWAETYIREVVGWGVMQVYQGYVFSPEVEVTRQMFAEVAYRTLELLGMAGEGPRPALRDVARIHYFYDEFQAVVGNGVLELTGQGRFEPLRPMSGAEAIEAVQRLARLSRRR